MPPLPMLPRQSGRRAADAGALSTRHDHAGQTTAQTVVDRRPIMGESLSEMIPHEPLSEPRDVVDAAVEPTSLHDLSGMREHDQLRPGMSPLKPVGAEEDARLKRVVSFAHQIRQPLQSLDLIHSMLAEPNGPAERTAMLMRMHEAVRAISRLTDELLADQARGVAPVRSSAETSERPHRLETPVVYIVDDDQSVRELLRMALEDANCIVRDYGDAQEFLIAYRVTHSSCLILDAYLPAMNGLDVLRRLRADGDPIPTIVITGNSDVPMAVAAMQEGADDFLEKPVGRIELIERIGNALKRSRLQREAAATRRAAYDSIEALSQRERQIMDLVLAGQPSKNIAVDLGISQRTVENHRAAIMKRTGVASLPELARLALVAAEHASNRAPTID